MCPSPMEGRAQLQSVPRGSGGTRACRLPVPERVSLQCEPADAVLASSSPQRPCHTLHIRVLEGHECADASSWQSCP